VAPIRVLSVAKCFTSFPFFSVLQFFLREFIFRNLGSQDPSLLQDTLFKKLQS
jgi:hypothetical protein